MPPLLNSQKVCPIKQQVEELDDDTFSVAVAVDISGSTAGAPLRAEIGAIEKLDCLVRDGSDFTVLPWDHHTHTAISLPSEMEALKNLRAGAGTEPSCLYSSAPYLAALKKCALWILMTDGLIDENEMHNFTRVTTENGMHGKACAMIVFGWINTAPPAEAEISVGIAAYALAANSLLLFHDIPSGNLYILQAKGSFTLLLDGFDQPVLNSYLRWNDLPQISYEDLGEVDIPVAQALAGDQIALEDNLVFRPKDMYDGNMSQDIVDRVSNPEYLRSLVAGELSRGNGKELEKWLQSQQKPLPQKPATRPDIGGKAKSALQDVLRGLKNMEISEKIETHRAHLRNAHDANWTHFRIIVQDYETTVQQVSTSNASFERASNHFKSMTASKNSYSRGESQASTPVKSALGYDSEAERPRKHRKHAHSYSNPIENQVNGPAATMSHLHECFLPGFKRNESGAELVGKCMLCHHKAVLTLLLKALPSDTFAPQGSGTPFPSSKVNCNIPISDILCSTICCDACASYIVAFNPAEAKNNTLGKITTAIACVSAADNLAAWTEALDRVCMGSVRVSDLFSLFAVIMKRGKNAALTVEMNKELGEALKWFEEELEKVIAGHGVAEGDREMSGV